jgi:predicted phage terminase large subunit-like protein
MESIFEQGEVFKMVIKKIELERNMFLPIIYDSKQKALKVSRIESMTPFFQNNCVFFNSLYKDTPDFKIAIEQLLGFSKEAENDDAPDAMHSAIENINQRISLVPIQAHIVKIDKPMQFW